MPGMDKAKIMALSAEISKKEGSGSMYMIGSPESVLKIGRWSTGIEDLDAIIGGGMPMGRTVEIFGAESAGKTTLAYWLCGRHEFAQYWPVEGTFDAARAMVMGCTQEQLQVGRASCGEDCMNKMVRFARAGVPVQVVDSVPSLIPRDDRAKMQKNIDKDAADDKRIGGIARLLTNYLPEYEDVIEFSGTTGIFVNQIRDKVGAMPFGDKTDRPGGHKFKHSMSLTIQVARRAWIEIPNKNPHNSAVNEKIGIIMKCKVVKSKVCEPYGECEIPLFFERGFVSHANLKQVRDEIAAEHKEKYKNLGKSSMVDDWADVVEDEEGWD